LRINFEYTIFFANSLSIDYLIREFNSSSFFLSRIQFEFTSHSLSFLRIDFELFTCFVNLLRNHYLFREIIFNSLSCSRIQSDNLVFFGISLQIVYLFREFNSDPLFLIHYLVPEFTLNSQSFSRIYYEFTIIFTIIFKFTIVFANPLYFHFYSLSPSLIHHEFITFSRI